MDTRTGAPLHPKTRHLCRDLGEVPEFKQSFNPLPLDPSFLDLRSLDKTRGSLS